MEDDRLISVLERIPRQILLNCAKNLLYKNDLDLELEGLMEGLKSMDLEDFDSTMRKIRRIKQQQLDLIQGSAKEHQPQKSNCITRSKVPLRDYQVKAIKFITDPTKSSLLVVHGTGTGKTLTALAASQCFLDANPNSKVVVISPASLTGNFEKEMVKYGGKLSENYSFYSYHTFSSLNKGAYLTPFDFYRRDEIESYMKVHPDENPQEIVNNLYEQFIQYVEPQIKLLEKYKKQANDHNMMSLYDCKNKMVIIDEAHNMRNLGARYSAAFKCVIQSKKLLLLTATPFVNRLQDFVSIINMLYRDDKLKLSIPKKITKEDKYRDCMRTIRDRLEGKVTYLNKKESEFFPSVKIHNIEIDMTPDYYEKYQDAILAKKIFGDAPEKFYGGFRRGVDLVGADEYHDDDDAEKTAGVVGGVIKGLGAEYVNQKLNVIIKLIKKRRQTLIFTNWIEAGVDVLENSFQDNDITYLLIAGKVAPKERLKIVEDFNNKKAQVLIITLAGSEGLDLKEVRDVIILDPVWNPAVMEQIVGRAVRFKSHIRLPVEERKVDVYNMILKAPPIADVPSGDEILYNIIRSKGRVLADVNKMLQDASDSGGFGGNEDD